ncbi:MAG: 4Fe-4S binding protein [Chloroflexi bacterium]|nr:4Fe-4S binding protein [Chloroflexota bacterium]
MPGKVALVEFEKCDPSKCEKGVCAAAQVCPRKLVKQETPYEIPMFHPTICKGCSECARVCPQKAVKIVTL